MRRTAKRSSGSLLSIALRNKANGVYPAALKHWWPCDDATGSRMLREPVSGMRYRSDLPSYNSATSKYDLHADTFPNIGAWINNDGLLDMDPDAGAIETTYSNKLMGEVDANGFAASSIYSAGTNPWIFSAYFKPLDAKDFLCRLHLGINNHADYQRLVLHNGFNDGCVVYGNDSTGEMGITQTEPDLANNNITSVYAIQNKDAALHSLVFDGNDIAIYRFGDLETANNIPPLNDNGNEQTAIHGSFSPTNGMGLSGNEKYGGLAWRVFENGQLPPDFQYMLEWEGKMWEANKKVIWPK